MSVTSPGTDVGEREDVSSSQGAGSAEQTDVQGIPAVLVQALSCMAVVMFLSAIGLGLYHYRESLSTALKIGSLLCVPLMLWGVYYLLSRRGFRSAEVVAMLSCLSWADVLIIVQTCLYPMPLWVCGLIFLAGLVVVPCIHPWRSAVVALLVGSMAELGLLSFAGVTGQISTAAVWLGVLALLMLWILAGCWCCLSTRATYRAYRGVASVAFALFLAVYYALVLFPEYLLSSFDGPVLNGAMVLWVLVLLLALPIQVRFARRQNRSVFSPAFLVLFGCALLSVPLLFVDVWPFITAPLSLLAALSLIYYGAVYKSTRILLVGCIVFYVAVFGNVLRLGIAPMGAAALFMLLSGGSVFLALRLHARRASLLSAVRNVRRRRNASSDSTSVEPRKP